MCMIWCLLLSFMLILLHHWLFSVVLMLFYLHFLVDIFVLLMAHLVLNIANKLWLLMLWYVGVGPCYTHVPIRINRKQNGWKTAICTEQWQFLELMGIFSCNCARLKNIKCWKHTLNSWVTSSRERAIGRWPGRVQRHKHTTLKLNSCTALHQVCAYYS